MDFNYLLQNIMQFIWDTLFQPINSFVGANYIETSFFHEVIDINGLFGLSNFPTIVIYDILLIVVGFVVSITALCLFWKFIKFLNGFLKGLFTGIKR